MPYNVLVPSMRCQFIKWNGVQCLREAADARDKRCSLHNNKGAASKTMSMQALAMARMPACEALYDIIDKWDRARCDKCGYPDSSSKMLRTIIHAAMVVLDRTGMGPRHTIDLVPQTDGDVNLDLMTIDEREEFYRIAKRFRELKAIIRERTEALGAGAVESEMPPAKKDAVH